MDHLIFRGLGFFDKNGLFPNRSEKNKMSSKKLKNKKFIVHSVNFFKTLSPGSYKDLQITQNLTCIIIKHVDLLLASSVLNVNYKIRKKE